MTEENDIKEKEDENNPRLREDLDDLRKGCIDGFIKALEGIDYHPYNIKIDSGYFIFYMGEYSVANFNIKELPGWKFGLWLNILDKKIDLEFFTQFESDMDKFKPSRSTYVEHCEYDLDETGTKLDYNKLSSPENLFDMTVYNRHIKYMLDFIKDHPYRAWANSYSYQGKYSIPWSNLRCWYEYHKHKCYIRKKTRIQDKYDKILIDWILKNMSKYFEGIYLSNLENVSPSYVFYAPLSKNRDLFNENGIYGMFYTEDECKNILDSTESSEKELDLANKNKLLINEYKKLRKKLQDKAYRKHVAYYPEVEADILIFDDKYSNDMRREAEVEAGDQYD